MDNLKLNITQEEIIQKFVQLKKTKPTIFKALEIIVAELEKGKK